MSNNMKADVELQQISLTDKTPKKTLDPSQDEADPRYKSLSEKVNFLSYINFFYMLKTILTAKRLSNQGKKLDGKTLPGFPYKNRAEVLEDKFMNQINKQKELSAGSKKKINLTLAIIDSVKWPIFFNIVLEIAVIFLKLFLVWVSKKLLDALSDSNSSDSEGYMWTGILSAVMIIGLYMEHNYNLQATLVPIYIRSGIISMIYTKIARLSVYSLNKISLGKLVNIVANDVNVFERTGAFFSNLFAAFFGIAGGTGLLWIFFGPSCLVGIGYCIVGFPLQQFIAKMSTKPRDKKNEVTDERVKMTNEVIDGIRLLKMYTWELVFRDIITKIRSREIGFLKQVMTIEGLSRGIAFSTQAVASFLIWMTYVLNGQQLTVSIVFPSILLIGTIRMYCVFLFSLGLSFVVEAKLLIKRIEDILGEAEIGERKFEEPLDSENAVEFSNFNAYWTKEQSSNTLQTDPGSNGDLDKASPNSGNSNSQAALFDINLQLKKGSLNALIGKVGSGKSSFLLSLTGEMPKTEGTLRYKGSIAYVEQEPTIFSGTLRDNILFGKEYKPEFYNQVIESCNLESDIKMFPNGDLSEIGEKGINLSGGQKARLTLARAVYADADIYLLDDPLSAVDAKVAKSLYHDLIVNQLKGKTVILATHQVHFIKDLQNIIVMDDGKVIGTGAYDQLREQNVDVTNIFSSEHRRSSICKSPLKHDITVTVPNDIEFVLAKQKSLKEQAEQVQQEPEEEVEELKSDEEKGKLFSNEDAYAGRVNLSTFGSYIKQMGRPFLVFMLFLVFLSNELANVAFSRIVGIWTSGLFTDAEALGILGGITFFILIAYSVKNILLNRVLLRSARSFHDKMLDRILRNPVQFFDTNPVGRILNRFSNDLGVLDRFLPLTITDALDQIFLISSTLITVAVINPIILGPIALALVLIIIMLRISYQAIKQTRNYELGSRSPLYSLFSSSLAGIIIIRSYKQTDNFIHKFRGYLHNSTKGSVAFWSVSRLFGFSVDFVYTLTAIACIFIVTATRNRNSGLSGLSISYILSVSGSMQFTLKQLVQMNVLMASVGRIKAYCETSTEEPLSLPQDEQVKKTDWSQQGKIEMSKVYMKYRPNTDHVIKDLTLSAQPGEKIGCIGRTGAGKSSIIQILFRMIEIDKKAVKDTDLSSVTIDGVDSQSLGLHTLRNSISIIPQTPFVFTGTIKRNLDPIGQFSDEELWKVLEDVNLKAHVEKLDKKLYTDMTNSSSVFSVGQKQLICLARAILKKSKLLVLDEATANVDLETDNFIQKKIMEKFSDCTIFTIAHRLSTIANYDKVLVLDKGRKVEFDAPYRLLVKDIGDEDITNSAGYFASMVLNTGSRASRQILKIARKKYFENHQA